MTSPTDREFEQMLQEKGLNAPRITPDLIQANIKSAHYFTASQGVEGAFASGESSASQYASISHETGLPVQSAKRELDLLTFCVLVLQNGFTVTGESACASPENFDAEAGRIAARRNAENKIWPLMGYALRTKLHEEVYQNLPYRRFAHLPEHVQRIAKEHEELAERLEKLDAFTNSEAFLALSELERTDLLEQGILMAKYRNKLKDRLDRMQAAHAA